MANGFGAEFAALLPEDVFTYVERGQNGKSKQNKSQKEEKP